jgi:hypothetical protein
MSAPFQLTMFETTAPSSSPIGLTVILPKPCGNCGLNSTIIGSSVGPHYARLNCEWMAQSRNLQIPIRRDRKLRPTNRADSGPSKPIPAFRRGQLAVQRKENVMAINLQVQSSAVDGQPAEPASDPFDLNNLRLDQSFVETAGVKKLLTTVPVRKPNQHDYNRVHPDPAYRANLAVIKLRDERDEVYLLTPSIASALPGEFGMATVFTAINRQGVLFLWPVMLPQPDGRPNEWNRSAAEAAEMAMTRWVRVKANMSLGAYEI